MNHMPQFHCSDADSVWQTADRAARALPPAFALSATVAVNPFVGQADQTLAETATLMARLKGISLYPPRDWYASQIACGDITHADLAAGISDAGAGHALTPQALVFATQQARDETIALADMTDLAAGASGIDWPRLIKERIGAFLGVWFDQGQALWPQAKAGGVYAAWKAFASADRTLEIAGLKQFRAHVSHLPATAREAIFVAANQLGLTTRSKERTTETERYFHSLLLDLGGYGQYARQLQFAAERDGAGDDTVIELLAIRLCFETALHAQYHDAIAMGFRASLAACRQPLTPDREGLIDAALQAAAERAHARQLLARLAPQPEEQPAATRPTVQAVFCIDVRSEVFRRALETTDAGLVTSGFAGFFGMGIAHQPGGSSLREHRMPVLLPAGQFACTPADADDAQKKTLSGAFGRFRQAAVSSFAFVEALGPVYAAGLAAASLRLSGKKNGKNHGKAPHLLGTAPLADKCAQAERVLRGLSMTENFARLVVFVGHGATTTNNPFASALQCGACGGHAGDVNARLLAALLNEDAVRAALVEKGIVIPADTLFLAGLHDTVTDEVTLYAEDVDAASHGGDIARLADNLALAGKLARAERQSHAPVPSQMSPSTRSRDFAELRPEWGLAGCTAFIAAERSLTRNASLDGKVFLHDYCWEKDKGFAVLEQIMTAPVVVASWINLQYYGSSVAPALYGAGNKLLHNVVGGIGVLEGNGGMMRAGLPFQSVHDGKKLRHDPLRLLVVLAAPVEAVGDILTRHAGLCQLFDQGWMRLAVLDPVRKATLCYAGNGRWSEAEESLPEAAGF
ncbi:DUF2309 domain-containing protein [Allorhizobium sp. BGMRC 0089]|uniref:YbcC family protein n=1 Tax=Allorhizobium sonneratiae TaxID=2934936 RepID=UPI0020343437|nr:DUF2309 domain-containing protein [Allorhizobium sonneratiae]MCM2292715.1 DUF2309 domain-containing protein [Allorhizobium sonneratiae]